VCGRYSLTGPNPAQVRARFGLEESVEVRRRYNVAPGDDVVCVTTARDGAPRGDVLRWGLVPHWARDPATGFKMINARAETVADKPAYRDAFARRRCLVVADGFYEWRREADGRKAAHWITRADGAPFAFAGLWATWRREREDPLALRTCSIVTTAANARVAELHDRMPVILPPEAEAAWLDPATPAPVLHELLRPFPAVDTALRPVGPAVNDARYDGPECLAPPPPPAVQTLF